MTTSARTTDPVADRIQVRIRERDFEDLQSHLVRPDENPPIEHAAFLVAGTQTYTDGESTVLEYLIREVRPLKRDDYLEQGSAIVRFDHTTTRAMMRAADMTHRFLEDMTVLMCHSHPRSRSPNYSGTDDRNEPPHMASLSGKLPGPHGSLLFGRSGVAGRAWSPDVRTIREEGVGAASTAIDQVIVTGDTSLRRIRTTNSRLQDSASRQDSMRERQALLHGTTGNQRLREAHVGVVGAGGLGSLVVQTLAHMGVGRITVVDPDVVETSNRARIVGARPDDAGEPEATPQGDGIVPAQWADHTEGCGRPKVDVLGRMVGGIDPDIEYTGIPEVVQAQKAMKELQTADILVSATDTATSRRFVSQAAQVYLRPLFNVGTDIDVSDDGSVQSIATGFHVSGANRPCLDCMGVINADRIHAEGEDLDQLEYGLELVEGEQPSVITINMEAAQRVTFAIHRYLTGLLSDRRDFRVGTYSVTSDRLVDTTERERSCIFCDGTLTAAGDRTISIGKRELYREAPPVQVDEEREGAPEEVTLLDRLRDQATSLADEIRTRLFR